MNIFKRLIMIAAVVVVALGATSVTNAHTPPGNDGGYCHGANKESCRPDPQPSHGQDCKPHGNNQDGNDDHCASVPPTSGPSTSPSSSPVPSVEPSPTSSTEPSPTPSSPDVDTGGQPEPGTPGMTLPPTDTE